MHKLFMMLRQRCGGKNTAKLLRRVIRIALCAGALGGLIYLAFLQSMPELLPLLKGGSEEDIAAYIGSQPPLLGILCTALLAFLQPVSIVLPGAPIQIAAGVVYGTLKGFLICHSAYVLANVTIFYLARVLREKMERHLARFSGKLDFLKKERHPAYMTAMACLTPLLPNGIIPYAAARTKIRLHEFTLAVVMGSFFPVLIMCAIGKRILQGDYLYAAVLLILDLFLVFVLTKWRNKVCDWLYPIGQRILQILRRADDT